MDWWTDGNRSATSFGHGANFIVYKPVSVERAAGSLRAARV
jgi:hypothetical protein